MENTSITIQISWPEAFFADWPWRALRVEGSDQEKFLNGIVTNTIKGMQEGDTHPSFALTVKGRIIAEMLVTREQDAFLLWTDAHEQDALWGHVDHYHVIEDVTFGWSDQAMLLLGGSRIAQRFEALGITPPEAGKGQRWSTSKDSASVWISRMARFEAPPLWVAWGSQEALRSFQEALQTQGAADFSASAQALAFCVGWYGSSLELKDLLIHEAGAENTHVNFKKGCFIGQEVVARTHWRGKANKGLFLLGSHEPLDSDLQPNTLVYNQEDQEVGQIRRRQTLLGGQEALRALLRLKSIEEQDRFHAILSDGSRIPLQRLDIQFS